MCPILPALIEKIGGLVIRDTREVCILNSGYFLGYLLSFHYKYNVNVI